MALVTRSLLEMNAGAAVTEVAGAATQEIDFSDRKDNKFVILIENGDALPCRVTFKAGNSAYAKLGDMNVDIAAGEKAAVGYLESARFKNADGQIDVEVLDQDDTAFSGTVGNVLFTVLELPKALID